MRSIGGETLAADGVSIRGKVSAEGSVIRLGEQKQRRGVEVSAPQYRATSDAAQAYSKHSSIHALRYRGGMRYCRKIGACLVACAAPSLALLPLSQRSGERLQRISATSPCIKHCFRVCVYRGKFKNNTPHNPPHNAPAMVRSN